MIDGTATLRGLTIGKGTPYEMPEWPEGLLDTAPVRIVDVERPRRSGVTPGDDLLSGRHVAFFVRVRAGTFAELEQRVSDLAATWAPSDVDEWLDVRLSGTPAEYSLRGRARGIDAPVTRARAWLDHGGSINVRCSFMATDPTRYGAEQSVSLVLGAGGPGLEYPVEYPVVYGGGSGTAVGSAVNAGTTDVDWTATLTGPLTNPRLEHVESGRFIRVAATLTAGQTLLLDSSAGALLFGGVSPRPTWFAAGSRWFLLAPGSNSVRLTADTGMGSALIEWRPGWA